MLYICTCYIHDKRCAGGLAEEIRGRFVQIPKGRQIKFKKKNFLIREIIFCFFFLIIVVSVTS